jgi:hypothetical protein
VGIPVLVEQTHSAWLHASVQQAAISLAVPAWGLAEAGAEHIAELRAGLSTSGPAPLASALKHADPQSILGLSALRQALTKAGLPREEFSNWGVVGCPREPGRAWMMAQLERFAVEGAWSVSPHIVPHCSLHSLAGLLSQALATHGANLGVGGLAGLEEQALRVAGALLANRQLSGVWVVWTGWDPEPLATEGDSSAVCRGLALALQPVQTASLPVSMCLRLTPPQPSATGRDSGLPLFSLEGLAMALSAHQSTPRRAWQLGDGGRLFLVGTAGLEGGSR